MSLKSSKNLLLFAKYFVNRINLFHRKRNFLNNGQIPLLLPKYWSFPNQKTKLRLLLAQIKLVLQKHDNTGFNKYMSLRPYGSDKYIDLIKYSKGWQIMSQEQKQNIELISKVYNSDTYSFEQEGLFGEGFLNGENPYALQRIQYDPNNQYQKQIFSIFNQENKQQIDTKGLDFKVDLNNLESQISKNVAQIYLLNFDSLRRLYQDKDEPIVNNNVFEGVTYTHIPYALFLKANLNNKTRFVCLCAAFKYTKEKIIKVLSPYLKNIPYKLWNIARMHTALPYFNDFSVRIHLGRMHFATSQFNAPLYNFYYRHKHDRNITNFYDHAYNTFNSGLEGVNLNATALLVPPTNSLEQDVFVFKRSDAIKLIGNDLLPAFFSFNNLHPDAMIKQKNLHQLVEQGSALSFNRKLYEIIAEFIDSLYKHYHMQDYQTLILQAIRDQLKNVIVFQSLPLLLKNLVFTWVVSHAHTKNAIQFPTYYKYQPCLLKKAIPIQPQIEDLDEELYIPGFQSQADQIFLAETVSVQDKKNFLLDVLREKRNGTKDSVVKGIYEKIITKLQEFARELKSVNEKRFKDSKFRIDWLNPETMQASLNI